MGLEPNRAAARSGSGALKLLREDGDITEYHVGTANLTLWRTDAEAYRIGLAEPVVCAYVVLQPGDDEWPYRIKLITANPHEAMTNIPMVARTL